jgi:hypothetical protein
MADFLQFRINEFLEQFPRITKLNNSEVPDNENDMIVYLLKTPQNSLSHSIIPA